jgi:hypothetical protein
MTPHIPFDIFTSDLLPTERIEWTGQPEARIIFHHEDWLVVPFSLMWGGFAIFWLVSASGVLGGFNHPNRTFEYFGIIWGTPFVFVGQYLIWGRFLYARWKKREPITL